MDVTEHVKALNERAIRINHEQQNLISDHIRDNPGQPFGAELSATIAAQDADISAIQAEVRTFVARDEREKSDAELREAHGRTFGAGALEKAEKTEAETFRNWILGNDVRHDDPDAPAKNAIAFSLRDEHRVRATAQELGIPVNEARSLLWDTGSIASGVPTVTSPTLYQLMTAGIAALRMPTTKLTSDSGAPIKFPRVNAHGIGTQVIAQGTAIGGTDPTFLSMQLDAFKYGQLLQVANETITDTGFDVVGFVTSNIARAVAQVIDADLIVGTGSGEPLGMMAAGWTGAAGTVATGGTLITPTYENLVDLVYSVNDQYRADSSSAFLTRDATAGILRKLRDGAGGTLGQPLWQMSPWQGLNTGEPDRLLGYPVYVDANVASCASNARIVAFGAWNAYYTRLVGDFVIERSDDYAFNTDLVTFRGKQRIDGDTIDVTAVNILKQSV